MVEFDPDTKNSNLQEDQLTNTTQENSVVFFTTGQKRRFRKQQQKQRHQDLSVNNSTSLFGPKINHDVN